MENKKPNLKRLTYAVVIFILIIIIGMVTMRKPYIKYEITVANALTEIMSPDYEIHPIALNDMLLPDQVYNYVFLDIRNPYEYYKGHIEGAINVPLPEIISASWLEQLKQWQTDGKTVVLYGNSQLEANAPWMLLLQLGFNNTKVLTGGYNYIAGNIADTTDIPLYMTELARYDFTEYMNSNAPNVVYIPNVPVVKEQAVSNAAPTAKKPEVIVPVKQEHEEEEEEGC